MGGNKKRKKKLRRFLTRKLRRKRTNNVVETQPTGAYFAPIQPIYSPVSNNATHVPSALSFFASRRPVAPARPVTPVYPQQPVRPQQPFQPDPAQSSSDQPAQRSRIKRIDLQLFARKKSKGANNNQAEVLSDLNSIENWITLFDKFKDDPTARRIYFSAKKGDFELAINNYNMFDISKNFLLQDLYLAFASGKEFRTAEVLKDASESDELIYSYKTKHSKSKTSKKDLRFLASELPTNADNNFVLENLTDSINIAKLLTFANNHADYIELTLNDDSKIRINLNLHKNIDGSIDYSQTRIELDDLMILLSNAESTKSINFYENSADPAVDDTIISTIDIETLPKDKIVIPKGVKIAGATILATGVLALGSLGLYQAFNGEQEVIDTQPIPDTSTSQNVDANSQQTPSSTSTDSKDFFEVIDSYKNIMAKVIGFAKACNTELTDAEAEEIIDCVCKGACEWCHGEQHGEQQEETQTPSEEDTTETPEQDTNDSGPSCKPVKPPCKPTQPNKPVDPPSKPVDPPSNEPTTEEEYVVDKVIGNVGENENNSGVTPGKPNNEPITVPNEKPDCEPSQPSQPSQPNTPGLPNEDNIPVIPPSEDGPTLIPGENTGCDTTPENPPTDDNTPVAPPTDNNTPNTPPTDENEHVVPDFTFPNEPNIPNINEPNIPNITDENIDDQPHVVPPSYSCDTPNEQNTPNFDNTQSESGGSQPKNNPFEIESNRPSGDSSESGSSRNGGGNGSSAMDYFHTEYGSSASRQNGNNGPISENSDSNGSGYESAENVVDDFSFGA